MTAPFYWHNERQWTLGRFIDALNAQDANAPIRFDRIRRVDYGEQGLYPGRFVSHRGDYSHLSLDRCGVPTTVGALRELAVAALTRSFEGWKGGSYRMFNETPLWAENYGDCFHIAVVGLHRARDGSVVIRTAKDEPA